MKAHLLSLLLVSSFLLSFVDVNGHEEIDVESDIRGASFENNQKCGPQTFSDKVLASFRKQANLDKYSYSQVHYSPHWVIVLNYPHCNYHLEEFVAKDKIRNFKPILVLSGTWLVEFQDSYLAEDYLSQLKSSDLINYLPIKRDEIKRL